MKKTLYQTLAWGFSHIVFPKAKTIYNTQEPDEPAVFLCNHSGMNSPANMTLYFKKPHKTWMIGYAFDKQRNQKFIYHDWFFAKTRKCKWFWKALSWLMAKMVTPLYALSNPIKVYHDKRMLSAFRESNNALKAGESVVIFAEQPERFSEFVNQIYEGFADIGRIYYTDTKKRVKFYPVYVDNTHHTINVGEPIVYDENILPKEQRKKIAEYVRDNIDALARKCPKHKPIPFLPERWYKGYGEYEKDPIGYWQQFEN